jgi:hypothetical protein
VSLEVIKRGIPMRGTNLTKHGWTSSLFKGKIFQF